jgi:hypothetical protein
MVDFAVPCKMEAFPRAISSVPLLEFTDSDLARALFTTGRAPGDEMTFGAASIWEFVHRASLIPAYVRAAPGARLVRSRLALDLDRSEKVSLSYSLGQALTAIFCQKVLGARHMMHVDRYEHQYGLSFGHSRQRPDLFGESGSRWIVAEAKGRSRSVESGLREKLMDQKRMVKSIRGRAPWIAVGCVAAFSLPSSPEAMTLYAFDPDEDADDAVDVPLERNRFVLAYYEPFLRALDSVDQAGSAAGSAASLVEVGAGVSIGLEASVEQRVRAAVDGAVEGLADDLSEILAPLDPDGPGQWFPDGSAFSTSWAESLNQRDFEPGEVG